MRSAVVHAVAVSEGMQKAKSCRHLFRVGKANRTQSFVHGAQEGRPQGSLLQHRRCRGDPRGRPFCIMPPSPAGCGSRSRFGGHRIPSERPCVPSGLKYAGCSGIRTRWRLAHVLFAPSLPGTVGTPWDKSPQFIIRFSRLAQTKAMRVDLRGPLVIAINRIG